MYFQSFPTILYDFQVNGKTEYKIVTDVTENVRIRTQILANVTLYDEYDIRDGETPEIIAEKVYGNPLYHWVVMLCNERYNYVDDFPLSTYNLEKYITDKYGSNKYATHHYVDLNGYIVDSSNPNATSVSNYDYETNVNESKRRIKLISPALLQTILQNFKDII